MNTQRITHTPTQHDSLTAGLFDLVELHGKLLSVESKRAAGSARKVIVFGSLAVVAGLATVPVALLAIAHLLVESLEWSMPAALLASAGIGATISVVCALVGYRSVRRCSDGFSRVGSDLQQSFAWLRGNLDR